MKREGKPRNFITTERIVSNHWVSLKTIWCELDMQIKFLHSNIQFFVIKRLKLQLIAISLIYAVAMVKLSAFTFTLDFKLLFHTVFEALMHASWHAWPRFIIFLYNWTPTFELKTNSTAMSLNMYNQFPAIHSLILIKNEINGNSFRFEH